MALEGVTPRMAVAIGLAAIVPIVVYGITGTPEAALMAAVNVVIIVAALYLAFGPVGSPDSGHA